MNGTAEKPVKTKTGVHAVAVGRRLLFAFCAFVLISCFSTGIVAAVGSVEEPSPEPAIDAENRVSTGNQTACIGIKVTCRVVIP